MLNKDGLEEICPFSLRGFDAQRGRTCQKIRHQSHPTKFDSHLKIAANISPNFTKNRREKPSGEQTHISRKLQTLRAITFDLRKEHLPDKSSRLAVSRGVPFLRCLS